jgi:sulfonate transport system substrate-binding protein
MTETPAPQKIRIGGVPEHFNLPVYLALEHGVFASEGIDVEWMDFPGGTGAMTRALRDGTCDVCLLLTEGIVADIIRGNPARIVSGHVKTPLSWGIHTAADSPLNSTDDIFDRKFAISRLGSGSHLMPVVDALQHERSIETGQLVEVRDLPNAITSLNSGESEVFYWEKFITHPFVRQKKLKRIGEFMAFWPCFMIAATERIIREQPALLRRTVKLIHQQNQLFMEMPEACELVTERYGLTPADARTWFHSTEWYVDGWVSDKMLEGVMYTLQEAGIVQETISTDRLIWKKEGR